MSDQVKYNKLAGKRVLIIGGTSGLGFTTTEASLEQGAHVIVSSSNQSRVEQTIEKLNKSYPSKSNQVSGHVCDLSNPSTVEANIEKLLSEATDKSAQKLDHIVYTAADSLAVIPVGELTAEAIQKAGQLRFVAPLLVGKHAPKYMHNAPTSSITLTTGSVSERPIANWSLIGSYATGLQGMTRGLGLDLAPIRVNCVSPGFVDTELWKDMSQSDFEALKDNVRKASTTGELAQPQDIAEAYLYLMKDKNVTGSMISTNSGHLLK